MMRPAVTILVLAWACSPANAGEAQRLLLLGQKPDGHPRATHEYVPGMRMIERLLAPVDNLTIEIISADEPWSEGPERIRGADAVVVFLSEGAKWLSAEPRRLDAMSQLAARGGGISALHWGMGTREAANIDAFVRLVGGCHGGPDRRYQVVETNARIVPSDHPIARGIEPFAVRDEFYYKLKFARSPADVQPILNVEIDGGEETVAWAWPRPDGGRSFGFSGLHFHDTWELPEYRRLVAQGILWTLGREIPRDGLSVDVPIEELPVVDAVEASR